MNFLAHAHLAYLTRTSITGNLLGDFVKGKLDDEMAHHWRVGIQLHRKIDSYTDSHAEVKKLKIELGRQRRYSGIILDILFDHIIAKHFDYFGKIALGSFAQLVYSELAVDRETQPPSFQEMTRRMVATDWLSNYQYIDVIEQALNRTSQRISSQPDLSQAIAWYKKRRHHVDSVGLEFYKELIGYSKQQAKSLILPPI